LLLCEQCECRTSSIGSAVEGCARGISFSRIEASTATLDRHERIVSMADRISPAGGGIRRYYAVVDMRTQLTNISVRMRIWTSTLRDIKCLGPRMCKSLESLMRTDDRAQQQDDDMQAMVMNFSSPRHADNAYYQPFEWRRILNGGEDIALSRGLPACLPPFAIDLTLTLLRSRSDPFKYSCAAVR
jgi:hypothetical protein